MTITSNVEAEALRLWQERELRLPGPGRRMHPDRMDRITGAWARCLAEAERLNSEPVQGRLL